MKELRIEQDTYQEKIAAIEKQLEAYERVLSGLRFLANPQAEMSLPRRMDLTGMGVQEAVLVILAHASVPMTPVEIRDTLISSGVEGSSPKNLLIAVHTAITRLGEQVEEIKGPDGKPTYKAKDSMAILAYQFRRKYAPLDVDGRKRRKAMNDAFMGR